MEMTIARDRWQLHLKTRGGHYHERAHELEVLHRERPGVGADTAALALHALAEILERCRTSRLTRHQHVLFRIGALAASGEAAGAVARRAARSLGGTLDRRSDSRFPPPVAAAIARLYAREAALGVAEEGLRLVCGADPSGAFDLPALETALRLPAIHAAQRGLLADMDAVADALYDRTPGARRAS
jgi:alkylation response protein AidB-like acyl-CoA dehydrogenase